MINSLFSLASRYNHKVVRCLAGMAWRGVIWGFFQPPLSLLDDKSTDKTGKSYFSTLAHFVDIGNGVSILAGLFSAESKADGQCFNRAMKVMELMFQKGCRTFKEALEVIRMLLNTDGDDTKWMFVPNRILLPSLHSANSGLLTEPMQSPAFQELIKETCKEGLQVSDITPLTSEELAEPQILKRLFLHVKRAAGQFSKRDEHCMVSKNDVHCYFLLTKRLQEDLTLTWQALIDAYMHALEGMLSPLKLLLLEVYMRPR